MNRLIRRLIPGLAVAALALTVPAAPALAAHKLLLLSIDGLDWRYIRDRDALGLKIPHIRAILAKSRYADGVVGVWPTITWPSHTTMTTGVRPDQHGILGNASGPPDPALSYWSFDKVKVPAIWQCLNAAGRTAGAINWPVTVNAPVAFDLAEVYASRNGDSSDMATVEKFEIPKGLAAQINAVYPSFRQQWLDDRSRTLATIYLLKHKQPDLIATHLAELDSESHAQGPFTVNAKAVVERTDELIGDILKAMPADYDLALVSDHGFEEIDHAANLKVMAAADGVTGAMTIAGGLVTTTDPAVAAWLAGQSGKGDVGRAVPHDELMRYAPQLGDAVAAYEPAPHVVFGAAASGPAHGKPGNKGTHGFWPARPDYHSIFLLSGPGVTPGRLGTIEMVSIYRRLQDAMGLSCTK